MWDVAVRWLSRIDPGTHRRIKGLRLVTAFGIAAMLGTVPDIAMGLPDRALLPSLAGGFALWGSVSEARATRSESSRDLVLLAIAAAFGAATFALLAPVLGTLGHPGPEILLASGAFCVGYLRRFGVTGTGVGSQIYIGQLLAYSANLRLSDLPLVTIAAMLAAIASVVPRVLSGPAEQPPPISAGPTMPAFSMGIQAAIGALAIVALNAVFGLTESAWAVTACTYVIAGVTTATIDRVRRRIIGTMIGVPIGLALLPLSTVAPLLVWAAAALAMVIYAMALPERYDIACGAYAFVLIVTLAVGGEHSITLLAARVWETILGGIIGLMAAILVQWTRAPSGRSIG